MSEFRVTEQRMFSTSEVFPLVRGNLFAWGAVAIVFCAIPSALIFVAVPKFRALFAGFGADLPASTMFLLNWRYLIWVLPALAALLLGVSLTAPADKAIARHRGIAGAFAGLCGLSLIVQALALVALYAPIFRLGAVV